MVGAAPSLPAPVPPALLEDAARRFRLLGEPTRLRILNALHEEGELTVGQVAARTGGGLANVSKHLSLLAKDGVVARRRAGTTVRYRIADPTVAALCDVVCTGIRDQLSALARRAG